MTPVTNPTPAVATPIAAAMLARAGVMPAAWPALRPWMKRGVVARALVTTDSRVIDDGVRFADVAFAPGALVRRTGWATGLSENVAAPLRLLLPALIAVGVVVAVIKLDDAGKNARPSPRPDTSRALRRLGIPRQARSGSYRESLAQERAATNEAIDAYERYGTRVRIDGHGFGDVSDAAYRAVLAQLTDDATQGRFHQIEE